jgi:hypothetical protein
MNISRRLSTTAILAMLLTAGCTRESGNKKQGGLDPTNTRTTAKSGSRNSGENEKAIPDSHEQVMIIVDGKDIEDDFKANRISARRKYENAMIEILVGRIYDISEERNGISAKPTFAAAAYSRSVICHFDNKWLEWFAAFDERKNLAAPIRIRGKFKYLLDSPFGASLVLGQCELLKYEPKLISADLDSIVQEVKQNSRAAREKYYNSWIDIRVRGLRGFHEINQGQYGATFEYGMSMLSCSCIFAASYGKELIPKIQSRDYLSKCSIRGRIEQLDWIEGRGSVQLTDCILIQN